MSMVNLPVLLFRRLDGRDLWHHYLARLGYVVISIDNRGTKTPRGRDWRKSIYGQIGVLASFDQKAAVEKVLQTYEFIDFPGRFLGLEGGGQMTLNSHVPLPGSLQSRFGPCLCV